MIVVIDTSVLMDIFLASRPRHAKADALQKRLKQLGTTVRIPMHGMFELAAGLKQEKLGSGGALLQFNSSLTEESPFPLEPIAIDEAFFQKYYSIDLPYLRAGDLIYVAMAKGDGLDLITEDDKQYKRAKEAGVKAYRIDEYIDLLGGGG